MQFAEDEHISTLLKVPMGFPLLILERISYTYRDKLVEVCRGWYVTIEYHYQNDLILVGLFFFKASGVVSQ
ncbi:UTRA domain-containing protein [Candidatus Pandoraea novymonadis]|uniref:UTRA domain-containing protein n=1 Tax=Candidatus Pandoraea novymonadis TaxID=1808959 RepID=UPI0023BA3656|nr:UTRA domain-containing protein [Candidatus Pandoraea novymonadis]